MFQIPLFEVLCCRTERSELVNICACGRGTSAVAPLYAGLIAIINSNLGLLSVSFTHFRTLYRKEFFATSWVLQDRRIIPSVVWPDIQRELARTPVPVSGAS